MPDLLRYAGQVLFYAIVMVGIGYFSQRPIYRHIPPDKAQILLSFSHGGRRVQACRRLSYKEIMKLPPGQRHPNTCERRRLPIHVQLVLDGKVIFDRVLKPGGLSGDSPAHAYEKFLVPVGRHTLIARLEDRGRTDSFTYVSKRMVELRPRQNLPIDFKADKGGFIFYTGEKGHGPDRVAQGIRDRHSRRRSRTSGTCRPHQLAARAARQPGGSGNRVGVSGRGVRADLGAFRTRGVDHAQVPV